MKTYNTYKYNLLETPQPKTINSITHMKMLAPLPYHCLTLVSYKQFILPTKNAYKGYNYLKRSLSHKNVLVFPLQKLEKVFKHTCK